MEPIDAINDWDLPFNLGDAVKYISRAGRKVPEGMTTTEAMIKDLKKAQFYLGDYIERMEDRKAEEDRVAAKLAAPKARNRR